MKPILLELVPIAFLAFAWFAIKNMDKSPEQGGWVARRLARVKWDTWILTMIAAIALALVITKSVL